MHRIHDVGERETLVRQEFLEFVRGITVNPVPCRAACYGVADLGELFGGKAKFARIPSHFPLLPAFVLRTGLRRSR